MPRKTIDQLEGYGFDIRTAEVQVYDNGMPVFNGTGEPKMQQVWQFVYTGKSPDGGLHIVMPQPLTDVERKHVVEALTGGITLASGIDLPPGVEI